MSNFGLKDLAVVEPLHPNWRDGSGSAKYGVPLLAKARVLSLEKAVQGCAVVLGTASAHNRAFRRDELTLPALRSWLKRRVPEGGKAAILFGSERNGLVNHELDYCHAVLRIPTVPEAPSMNLGQAVALTAYELAKPLLEKSVRAAASEAVNGPLLEALVDTAMAAMKKARVNNHLEDRARRDKFRRGVLRWRLTRDDAAWLRGLLVRLIKP
jgi:TrmH family RNA methyltransferase